jgi:protein-S-isoprenylcysteine O-methyltransferase Ste14
MSVGWKILRSSAAFIAVLALVIFLPAGTIKYWQAWLMLAIYVLCTVAMVGFLKTTDAAALERRSRGPRAEENPTQRRLVIAVIVCYFAVYVVAALDYRFGWSSGSPFAVFIGDALIIASFVFFAYVMRANAFAATNITVEREQPVATTGPYAIVRHPMYSGIVFLVPGISLALGSYWGIALVFPIIAILIVRLLDEERFLEMNLPGYREYESRVHWRLVPGIF